MMLIPYRLMYLLGRAPPWERRPVGQTWQRLIDGPEALPAGRALDVGCGTGRDAVYLAKRGWQVTGVDLVDTAIAKARQRAADGGVQVHWVAGDVSALAGLGLEPGYSLVYDFGCIQGLADSARAAAAAGITDLAAPGATLLLVAFVPGRRVLLPRGMDERDVIGLFGAAWELQDVWSEDDPTAPLPVRRAHPALYRLARKQTAERQPSS